MNRTRRFKEPVPSVPVPPLFNVEVGRMETVSGDTVHSLFAPLKYEPGYAYPLLVWLHGLHGDERQLLRIMPLLTRPGAGIRIIGRNCRPLPFLRKFGSVRASV